MDLGTGIAIAGISFTALGVFYRIVPPRGGCDSKHCQDHSGMVESIKGINSWMSKIDGKVDKLLRNGTGL